MTQIEHKNAKVLVTGVTGYVGSHVARQLLLHGYKVRGTVRNASDEEKMNKLRQQITDGLPENLPEFEFVEADLLKEETWPPAVAGCQYVCHVASPFPLQVPSDPNVLIKPAVDGTLAVLKAASADGNVKRVVLTSSLAAIHDVKTFDGKQDPDKVYNEDDWVDPDKVEAYSQSKILAEKAAYKFIEELPQEEGKKKLELVVINPSYVLGPLLTDTLSSSVLAIKRLLDRSTPGVPKFNLAICDVRDVALAHVKALESPEHVGKRYLILSECKWMRDVARMVQKEFKPLGYFVPTMAVPNALVWIGSFVDKSTALLVPRLGKEFKLDNKRMVEELKITPTDVEKTVVDTCYSLIDKNIIRMTHKYRKSKQPSAEEAAAETNTQAAGDVPPEMVQSEAAKVES
jgi:nucleoside-diphosphate-sugar epimerase